MNYAIVRHGLFLCRAADATTDDSGAAIETEEDLRRATAGIIAKRPYFGASREAGEALLCRSWCTSKSLVARRTAAPVPDHTLPGRSRWRRSSRRVVVLGLPRDRSQLLAADRWRSNL